MKRQTPQSYLPNCFITVTITYGLLLLCWAPVISRASHSSLRVINNGYEGLVVAINPEVGQDDAMIEKLKTTIIPEASKLLYNSIGLYLSQVTILVPSSWNIDNYPSMGIPITGLPVRYSDADVLITNRDFEQSFTKQWGGCGQHALPIVMTKPSVTASEPIYGDTAKLFVHQFAQYRYGVFNEFGFPSDPLYPTHYSIPGNPDSNQILVNSCADDHQVFNVTTQTQLGQNCRLIVGNGTGLPIKDPDFKQQCIPVPKPSDNSYESSLMYSPSVDSVNQFCGYHSTKKLHKHNLNSPNKQNSLCGSDTWTVISKHPDIPRTYEVFQETIDIKISKPAGPKVLFAVHTSQVWAQNKRYELINQVMSKFKLDMKGALVSLFTYTTGEPIVKVPWTTDLSQIKDLKPSSNPEPDVNFEKILESGINTFKADSVNAGGAVFTIFFAGKGYAHVNDDKLVKYAQYFQQNNIKLLIIVFPLNGNQAYRQTAVEMFEKVISRTGGQVFYIREDSNPMTTVHQLSKAMATIETEYSGDTSNAYHVISEQLIRPINNTLNFEFNVDETLMNSRLRVYFIGSGLMEEVVLKKTGIPDIKNPSYTDGPNFNGFLIDINKPDHIGKWQLTAPVDTTTMGKPTAYVAVAEFATKSLDGQSDSKTAVGIDGPVRATCWLKQSPNMPVIAYVNINGRIDELVSNMLVNLTVTDETGRTETFDMLDNGAGDPDITQGDGIYSQYVISQQPIINKFYYTVSAEISSISSNELPTVVTDFGSTSMPTTPTGKTCCGSKVNGQLSTVNLGTEKLNRVVECGHYVVTSDVNIQNYPPNAIRDLRVENADHYNRTVSLLWTSVGEHYTQGSATKYVIKAFPAGNDAINDDLRKKIAADFDNLSGASIEVTDRTVSYMSASKEQNYEIRIKSDDGGVYYVAVRAYNSAGKGGAVSNIVMAQIKSNVIITSTTAFDIDVSKQPVNPSNDYPKLAGLEWWEWLLVAIGGAVVLLLFFIFAICFVCKRRRKTTDETDREQSNHEPSIPTRKAPEPPRVSPELEKNRSILLDDNSLTRSVDNIPNLNINNLQQNNAYNSVGLPLNPNFGYNTDPNQQQNICELNVAALSPVQSWNAKDLLTHWGRVQEAKQRHEAPPVMRIEDLSSASSNHSPSYASSEDDNNIYTNPHPWGYQEVQTRPMYAIPNGYNQEPIYRSSQDHLMRSNTPSDTVPRYSTIVRKTTQNVSQV
ncbi:calcium-activated chloride channel regulator 1-like isoform X2 [Oppia nitens]|uniref:calcium-activated chloride channel regulator 1-like isoform X2 n=1 Tax=Oppia nitens TaxID=1686743 RepID=UPI0023DC3923|nr:calcium-activated chloride channel regulator 1-like isoform X2 [Oppia nitens]